MCFCNQAFVVNLGFLFSFSANSLSFDSTHWLSSSLVGCQQNTSSMCSNRQQNHLLAYLGQTRVNSLIRPKKPLAHWPYRQQITEATSSLTRSDPNGVAEDSSVLSQVLRHPGHLNPPWPSSQGLFSTISVSLAISLCYRITRMVRKLLLLAFPSLRYSRYRKRRYLLPLAR